MRNHAGVAERLIVEITESAAIHDIDETRGFVTRVKDLGCRIAIDDFGAGYTSFRNLRKLGVDIVKIDGAFVQHIMRSEDDRAFVRTLIDLARRLNLKTVAEWVQDEAAAQMLQAWGCDYLQGALIGLASTERPWLAESRQSDLNSASRRAILAGLFGQPIDFSLHLVELALEIVDVARFRRRLFRLRRGLGVAALAPRERREHGEGALEHFHVAPHLIFERGESADPESLRHLLRNFSCSRVSDSIETSR